MAGIYIHIPFCKTRCIYCDFYSTTQSELKTAYVAALCQELKDRKAYLKGQLIETIYFGGGTPSQLEQTDFKKIFQTIKETYGMEACTEITLEANPDDLTDAYLTSLADLPFNRISMGIQTFQDETLRLLNRRHNSQQAIEAVARCRQAGFKNISIDLIYGLPNETLAHWQRDLELAIGLQVEHLSAYHLTYEEDTPLYRMLCQQEVAEVDEESSVAFFTLLINTLKEAGYEQYEISNFCRPGKQAQHNSAYWKGIHYLGCGASAHSYNGTEREWNIASIEHYIAGIEANSRHYEREVLDVQTRYNDRIVTAIRTQWGLSLQTLEEEFGKELLEYCLKMADPYLQTGQLMLHHEALCLTAEGIFLSDSIMRDLLFVEEE